MSSYKEGQPVLIVAGLYKSKKTGVYVKAHGTKMCFVKVDGGGEARKLRLTSIAPTVALTAEPTEPTAAAPDNPLATDDDAPGDNTSTMRVNRSEYNSLLHEVDVLSEALRRLQLRVIAMDDNSSI